MILMTSNINFFSLTNYIKSIEKELIENMSLKHTLNSSKKIKRKSKTFF